MMFLFHNWINARDFDKGLRILKERNTFDFSFNEHEFFEWSKLQDTKSDFVFNKLLTDGYVSRKYKDDSEKYPRKYFLTSKGDTESLMAYRWPYIQRVLKWIFPSAVVVLAFLTWASKDARESIINLYTRFCH